MSKISYILLSSPPTSAVSNTFPHLLTGCTVYRIYTIN